MSPEDIEQVVNNDLLATRGQVLSGLDQNPDDAAKAVSLEKSTGVPSQIIAGDLDGFSHNYRSALAETLIMNNPQLRAYVHSHAMASAVSNDDWGTLDGLSQQMGQTSSVMRALNLPFRSVESGLEAGKAELERPITQYTPEEIGQIFPALGQRGPLPTLSRTLATGGINIGTILGEGLSNIFSAVTSGVGAAATTVGGPQLGREAQALTEYQLMKPEAKPHLPAEPPGSPWLKAGEEPPAGIHPAIDMAKAKINSAVLEQIDTDLTAAQASLTKERSPELFRRFVEQHYGNSTIGISGDTVAALYGDKVPEPGDGLLGWVPHITEQLEAAKGTGQDVEIPIKDWVARVDPAVAKALHDDLRVWPGGITAREAIFPPSYQPRVVETPVDIPIRGLKESDPPELRRMVEQAVDEIKPQLISAYDHDPLAWLRTQRDQNIAPEVRSQLSVQKPWTALDDVRHGMGDVVYRPMPLGAAPVDRPTVEPQLEQIKGEAAGLDKKSAERLKTAIQDRYEADVEKARQRAEAQQARRQTKEWRENRKEMAKEVEASIRQRPDVAADLFIGSGELNGQKLRQRFTLEEGALSPEQRAGLPDHYYSKNGLPPDEVAKIFGYSSGDAMIDQMMVYHALKGERSPQQMLKDLIESETDRGMELRYGHLEENILQDAKDQALSDSSINVIAEEYYRQGLESGQPVVDKAAAKEAALSQIGQTPISQISSDKLMALMGKHGRDAERALIGGDPASAFVSMQRKYFSALLAQEARKIEKRIDQFDRTTKLLSKMGRNMKESPVDPEYLNYLHQIMIQTGKGVWRSIQTIQSAIEAHGTGTLEDFVNSKIDAARTLAVWDKLYDPAFRQNYSDMVVNDFVALHDTIKSLNHNGREEMKVYSAGEAADLADKKVELKDGLRRFPELKYGADDRVGMGAYTKIPRGFIARAVQMESLLNYWDRFNKWGPWNQFVMRDLIDGANQVDRWKKEYAAELSKIKDNVDLSKAVDNPIFRNPLKEGGFGELLPFNRENLRRIMLDMGNGSGSRSNLFKRARGYGLTPDEVSVWVHSKAKKEDWDWVQKAWDIWDTIGDKADTMFRSQSGGVAPDRVIAKPIQTPFGEYRGGYYPANDYHPIFKGDAPVTAESLLQSNFVSATSPPGWSKQRTGFSAPLRNDLSNMANLMGQHLHDIAMRPAVVNASKVMLDKGIQNAIKLHMGEEYAGLMKPYLMALANRADYMSSHAAYANSWAEHLRTNLVTTLIGFNIGTVLKHAPTAFVMSLREVGPEYYLKANRMMYAINEETGETNKKFLDDNFLELSRRSRNWKETLYGQMAEQTPGLGSKYETLRQEVARLSSAPVAFSDMLSARPTALAGYLRAIDEGRSHGDAIYEGERAVRRAHGSTAITNRPAIMRDSNPWLTSVYNFFNDIFNRQLETVWRSGEMLRLAKEDQKAAAFKMVPAIGASVFAYAIWPAIVEQFVSPTRSEPGDSLTKKMVKAGVHTEAATLPYVRDFANFVIEGGEPSMGLIGTGMKEVGNFYRDFGKKEPFNPQHAERLIHDFVGLSGMLTGLTPQVAGNVAAFKYGVKHGVEHPRDPWGWVAGMRYGTLKHHASSFQNYLQGKNF